MILDVRHVETLSKADGPLMAKVEQQIVEALHNTKGNAGLLIPYKLWRITMILAREYRKGGWDVSLERAHEGWYLSIVHPEISLPKDLVIRHSDSIRAPDDAVVLNEDGDLPKAKHLG